MTTETTREFYHNYNSHFGGIIFPSDYDTCHSSTRNIASRIANDWNFDRYCKKNEEARNKRMMEEMNSAEINI